MFVSIFIEVISLGLIYPIIAIILEKKLTFDLGIGIESKINELLSSMSENEIFYSSLIFLLAVFFIKTILILFYNYFLTKQIYQFTLSLSKDMFYSLFRKNLYFFFKKNSNAIIRETCNEVQGIFKQGITPFFSLIVDLTLTVVLIFLIFITDFKLAAFLSILFIIIFFGYFFIIKKRLERFGELKIFHESLKMKNVSQFINV